MSKPVEDILTPKPEARPRIYAYAIANAADQGHVTRSGRSILQAMKRDAFPVGPCVKKYMFVYKMQHGGRKNS